jgi:hypothetical protein
VLDAVAEAPPPKFSGGGHWEAMHGGMGGYFEVRAQGPKREQFRLFCILENAEPPELRRRVDVQVIPQSSGAAFKLSSTPTFK